MRAVEVALAFSGARQWMKIKFFKNQFLPVVFAACLTSGSAGGGGGSRAGSWPAACASAADSAAGECRTRTPHARRASRERAGSSPRTVRSSKKPSATYARRSRTQSSRHLLIKKNKKNK